MDLSQSRDACAECAMLCIQAATHYLAKGENEMRDLVRQLWDCSDICEATGRFLNRGSPDHRDVCRACAAVCERCAEACTGRDDPIMQKCAASSRRCAELCRDLAEH